MYGSQKLRTTALHSRVYHNQSIIYGLGVSDSTEDDFKTYMTLLNSTQPCAIILTKDDLTPEPIEYFRITLTIVECPSILPVFCNAVIVDNDGKNK